MNRKLREIEPSLLDELLKVPACILSEDDDHVMVAVASRRRPCATICFFLRRSRMRLADVDTAVIDRPTVWPIRCFPGVSPIRLGETRNQFVQITNCYN
jgi:hypothetical protein